MLLTAKEIKELAEFALGITINVDDICMSADEFNDDDYEFTLSECPSNGVLDDDGSIIKTRHVITCDGCEPNECHPIGTALITHQRDAETHKFVEGE